MNDENGSVGRTALGFLALGFASALLGVTVVGPAIGKRMSPPASPAAPLAETPAEAPPRMATVPPVSPTLDVPAPASADPATLQPATARASDPAPEGVLKPADTPPAPDTEPTPTPLVVTPERKPAPERASEPEAPASSHAPKDEPRHEAAPKSDRRRVPAPEPEATVEEPPLRTSRRHKGADTPKKERLKTREDAPEEPDATPRRAQVREETPAPKPRAERPKRSHEEKARGEAARSQPAAVVKPERHVKDEVPAPEKPAFDVDQPVYRVRVGQFKTRDEAEKIRQKLGADKDTASIIHAGDAYRVQVGAFRSRENADKAAGALRSRNYQPEVSPSK
jgi:cell division protein FtsN